MEHTAVVVFDGVCNLCNSSVQVILKNDKNAYFSFASLQGDYGQNLLRNRELNPESFDSFLLVENEELYTKSTAALRVARKMDFPFNLGYAFIIIPRFIRDAVYGFIARNRYQWFGKKDACMIPDPKVQQRFIP